MNEQYRSKHESKPEQKRSPVPGPVPEPELKHSPVPSPVSATASKRSPVPGSMRSSFPEPASRMKPAFKPISASGNKSARKPDYRNYRGQRSYAAATVFALLVVGFIGFSIFLFRGASTLVGNQPSEANQHAPVGLEPVGHTESRVSFVAVGDNLPDIAIGTYGDAHAGAIGDGFYDYRPIYLPLKPYIQAADLAFISFETHAGGDNIGPRGYPSFNTTDAMVDAVADTGFNLIASATNHSYDWGFNALAHSASLWEQKDVLFTGTASNEEDAWKIKTIERKGIIFSLLSYTYGINGYDEEEIEPFAVNYMHEDRISNDIARAREVCDVVLVAMHWGTEYYTDADETQQYYARIIADAGADVILGSHTHMIGPLRWVEGASGNKTLVAYSLGNFLSHHEIPYLENELGGMLSCDFVKDAAGVRIENIQWTPLVNHSEEEGIFALYTLKDYTAELASRHRLYSSLDDPLGWLKATTVEIVGPVAQIHA